MSASKSSICNIKSEDTFIIIYLRNRLHNLQLKVGLELWKFFPTYCTIATMLYIVPAM